MRGGTRPNTLAFEAFHIAAVVAFQRGRLHKAKLWGKRGREFCEATTGMDLQDVDLFGHHDGRVCCKVFEAMSLLLQKSPEAPAALDRMLHFLHDKRDATSEYVGRGYQALYHILAENFDEAHHSLATFTADSHTGHWWDFVCLLRECAHIGRLWKSPPAGPVGKKLPDRIGRLKSSRWKIDEYRIVWDSFHGVALELAQNTQEASKVFEQLFARLPHSEEQFFQPQACRFIAWFERRRQNDAAARRAIDYGLTVAREMQAQLFIDRLQALALTDFVI